MLISHQSSRKNLKQQSFLSCGYAIFRLQKSVTSSFCVRVRTCTPGGCRTLFPGPIELVISSLHKPTLAAIEITVKSWKRVITFIWIRWRLRGVNNAVNTLAVYTLPEKFCETVSYWYPFRKTMLNRCSKRCFLKNSYERNNKIRYSFSVWGIILRLLCSMSNRNPKCCSITMDPAQKPHQRGDHE